MRLLSDPGFPPAIGGIQTYAASLAEVFAEHCESLLVLAPEQEGPQSWTACCRIRFRNPNVERLDACRGLPRSSRRRGNFVPDGILTGHWYVAGAALVAANGVDGACLHNGPCDGVAKKISCQKAWNLCIGGIVSPF